MAEKVKLAGGPDKTVTWIWLEHGQLRAEYYDFSEPAHKIFGNDIAWTITVQELDKLLSTVSQNEASILPWMEQYFKSYFGIKRMGLASASREKAGHKRNDRVRTHQDLYHLSCGDDPSRLGID
jgi:hypothetical protein